MSAVALPAKETYVPAGQENNREPAQLLCSVVKKVDAVGNALKEFPEHSEQVRSVVGVAAAA
jgi:hypothetical protein